MTSVAHASSRLPVLLKAAGLKVTPARKHILHLFSADCKPINAEYLCRKLKKKHVNQVTIYRTLASLERAGIIKRVDLRKDSIFYELARHHHHHIVCTGCGKTESFETCGVDALSKSVLKKSPLFKTVNQHSLELYGMCKSCVNR